jgi:hypothetical protein
MLVRNEAGRNRQGMGLAPWGVSPEEEREILMRELERSQPMSAALVGRVNLLLSPDDYEASLRLVGSPGKITTDLKPEVEFTYVRGRGVNHLKWWI